MYVIRSTAFLGYGSTRFVRGGTAEKDIKDLCDIDLKGKSFLVTGANSGIGFSVSSFFAKGGGTVHLICRNEERGKEALKIITESTKNENVHLHVLDISKMAEIKEFAQNFMNKNYPLDVLVHCAGTMLKEKEETSEGLDKVFATNLLSNFLLTNLLFPVLNQSKDGRVIFVSSGGGLTEELQTNDLQFQKMKPWDGTRAYAITKRQQIALAEKFASFYKDSNVSFFSMHPGWVDTPLVRESMPDFYNFYKKSLRSVEEGADTINWLAVSDKVNKKSSGEFFRDRNIEIKHFPLGGTGYSEKDVNQLWLQCSKLTGCEM